MTDNGSLDKEQKIQLLLEELRGPFLASTQHRLENLDKLIDTLWNAKEESPETLTEFLGIVHSLKGTAGSVGYPQISVICHHLETYLTGVTRPSESQLEGVQAHIDKIWEGLEIWPQPDKVAIQKLVDTLPKRSSSVSGAPGGKPTVLLVSQAQSIAQIASFLFSDLGFDVTVIDSPFDAFRLAIEETPDIFVSSAVLNELSGQELIAAIAATKSARKTTMVLLTSSGDRSSMEGDLPMGVQVVSTSHMEEEIELIVESRKE